MQMGGMLGSVHRVAGWLTKGAGVNLLWFLCNAPLFFIVMDIFMNGGQLEAGIGALLVLVPLLLFPSTAALFGVVRKWVLQEDEPAWAFFRYFKENIWQSLTGGVFFTIVWTGWLAQSSSFPLVVFWLISGWLSAWTLFFFAFQVHFHLKTVHIIKNALVMTAVRPLSVFMTAGISFTLVYIWSIYPFLLPFCSAVVLAYISFGVFHRFCEQRFPHH